MSDMRAPKIIESRDKTNDEKELAAELSRLNTEIGVANIGRIESEKLKVEADEKLELVNKEIVAKKLDYQNLVKTFNSTSEDLASVNTTLIELEKSKVEIQTVIATLEAEYQTKSKDLKADFLVKFSEANSKLADINAELSKARVTLGGLNQEIFDLTALKESIEVTYDKKIDDLQVITESIDTLNAQKETLESTVTSLETTIARLNDEVTDLTSKILEQKSEFATITENLRVLTEQYESLIASNKVEMEKIDQEKFILAGREKTLEVKTAFIKNK